MTVNWIRIFKGSALVLSDMEAETIWHALIETLGRIPDYSKEFGLKMVIQALIKERDKVVQSSGDYYGKMTIEELNLFITRLQEYQRGR